MRTMVKNVCAALVVGLSFNALAVETFTPYRADEVPQNVTDLWKDYDPRAEDLDVEVIKEWKDAGVVTRYTTFKVGTFKGADARIAAYYSFPDNGKKTPAFVWIHGGGQRAERKRGVYFAKQGFATLDINWLGRPLEKGIEENTDWGNVDPTQGAGFCSKAKRTQWKCSLEPDEYTIDQVVSPRNNNWFLLVVAARRAITFLEQQPEVDAERIGVTGFSMGGMVTALSSMDPRLKASAPFVGGTGFRYVDFWTALDKGAYTDKSDLHVRTADASAYWPLIKCPVIFISASNDFNAAFDRIYKSMDLLPHRDWRITTNLHENHRPGPEQWVMLNMWFDKYLKGLDVDIPITPPSTLKVSGRRAVFTVSPADLDRLVDTELYYSYDPNCSTRFWRQADATREGGTWSADIAVYDTLPLYAFALCRYRLDRTMTLQHGQTSTFTLNSLEQIHVPDQIDFEALDRIEKAETVIEDSRNGFRDWAVRDRIRYHESGDILTYKFQDPLIDLSADKEICITIDPKGRDLTLRLSAESRFLGNGQDLGSFRYTTGVSGDGIQNVLISAGDFKGDLGKPLAWDRIARFGITLVDVTAKQPVVLDSKEMREILKQIKMVDIAEGKARFVKNLDAGQKQTVVAFGTSLTAVGAWVDQLQTVLEQQYPGQATVINAAQGGANSDWDHSALDQKVLKHKPDAVLIELAVNDAVVSRQTSVAHACDNLENMIEQILKQNPHCEIILQVINPPIGDTKTHRPNLAAYNQMCRDVAKERGFKLIDHYLHWEKLLNEDPAKFVLYMPDTIHPLRDGALDVITPVLVEALGLKPGKPEQSAATPCLNYLTRCLIDKNKDREITSAESDIFWTSIFERTDINKDGVLQKGEAGFDSLFSCIDQNRDGKVSVEEYLKVYAPLSEVMNPDPEKIARNKQIAARGENAPNEDAPKAFDGNVQTKWLDFSPEGSWIQYRYDAATAISAYSITSADHPSARAPKEWQLLGSNDGKNWTTLDSRKDEVWSKRLEKRSFTINKQAACRFYRLNITAVRDVNNASSVQIAEIEFLSDNCVAATTRDSDKPNIILILADDLGTVDLNCYGSKDLYTPNLDRLADDGLRFSQFYVVAPVCASSRAAILTGRYPDHNGVVRNGHDLHKDETTIAEMLKPAGYSTALIGKWHVGMQWGGPNGEGFDYFYGHRGGCIENWGHNTLNWDTGQVICHDLWRNDKPVHREGDHFGDTLAEESINYIEQHKNTPFFLFAAFNSPHYPVQPLKHHYDRYSGLKEPRRSYAAFVSTLDEQVGRIVKAVDDCGLRENTMILFLSDHGCSRERRNALFIKDADPKNPSGGSSGPYRGSKFTVWEGGVRVPCIISQPHTLPEGETRDQVAASIDILPTVAKLAGVDLPAKPIDGKPLNSLFDDKNQATTHPALRYVSENKSTWAVRKGDWKLVKEAELLFLSDMSKAVTETDNLAEKYPEKVQDLMNFHEEMIQ